MASSVSPGAESSGQDKSPLSSLNVGFLKSLTEKKVTRDGKPAKRRGPKPDSKPAMTRRQELNRQAQRTHRERKELYIKALEDEVLRLKEVYTDASQDKKRLAEENRHLKQLLANRSQSPGAFGDPFGAGVGSSIMDDSISNPSAGGGYASSAEGGGGGASSYTSGFSPPPQQQQTSPYSKGQAYHPVSPQNQQQQASGSLPQKNPGVDYEQAGIDFVLTLERPCMAHLPGLIERQAAAAAARSGESNNGRGEDEAAAAGGSLPTGHALMMSCPPVRYGPDASEVPFGYTHTDTLPRPPGGNGGGDSSHEHHVHGHNCLGPGDKSASEQAPSTPAPPSQYQKNQYSNQHATILRNTMRQGTWELGKGDLSRLLDLSNRLDLDGEITPVMAWGMILSHPRLGELGPADFQVLAGVLMAKVRCYGFGAVMEDFEVRDAIENVLSTKMEVVSAY